MRNRNAILYLRHVLRVVLIDNLLGMPHALQNSDAYKTWQKHPCGPTETHADVANSRADIADIHADVADGRADIADTRADVADIHADVADIHADVADIRADIIYRHVKPAVLNGSFYLTDIIGRFTGRNAAINTLMTRIN
jgi:hypothetical protein